MWSNVAEAAWCSTNWIAAACLVRKITRTKALTQAESRIPSHFIMGSAMGFGIVYWNALMTVDDGPTTASKIATRHEDAAKNQPANEKTMDLRNNQIGQILLEVRGQGRLPPVRNSCKSRADARLLWYFISGKLGRRSRRLQRMNRSGQRFEKHNAHLENIRQLLFGRKSWNRGTRWVWFTWGQ